MNSDIFVESSIKLMSKLWSGLFEYWVLLSFSRILKRNAVWSYLEKLKWLSAGLWLAGLWQDVFDCVRLGFLEELPLSEPNHSLRCQGTWDFWAVNLKETILIGKKEDWEMIPKNQNWYIYLFFCSIHQCRATEKCQATWAVRECTQSWTGY